VPQKSKSKAAPVKSTDKLRQQILIDKENKSSSGAEIWWRAQIKELKGLPSHSARLSHIEALRKGKRAHDGWLAVELCLYHLHAMCCCWIDEASPSDSDIKERYVVKILRIIHGIRDHSSLFPAAAKILSTLLRVIGFGSFQPVVSKAKEDRVLMFTFLKLASRSKEDKPPEYPFMTITSSIVEFQLKAFGEYMDRSMNSTPDPRVSFEPDGWQREVSSSTQNPQFHTFLKLEFCIFS